MAITPTRELTFHEDDRTEIGTIVAELRAACTGWVNLLPEVEEGQEPAPRSVVASFFSARGEAVPLATWSAPEAAGRRASLGIEHGSGPKALDRLEHAGLALPTGWLKAADHPRRGLVVTSSADATVDDELWWLLTAAHALSVVPLSGAWRARVYRP